MNNISKKIHVTNCIRKWAIQKNLIIDKNQLDNIVNKIINKRLN